MSHFSVLVITKTKPDGDELHKILLPWHEYECTGFKEYVVDVDVTDETVADHKEHGEGKLDAAWVRDWNGAVERNGRYYRRTNPNKKWDWWVVGGRWTGMLVPQYDPAADPDNKDPLTGDAKWPTQWKKIVGDQMMLRDVPVITLRDEAEKRALDRHDRATVIVAGRPIPDWDALREVRGVDAARKIYNSDPVVVDLKKDGVLDFFDDAKDFVRDRATVARQARASALCPFAVVHEGKWHERGSMGWWGCISDEKNPDQWADEFAKLIDGLPGETWFTVVDCHI